MRYNYLVNKISKQYPDIDNIFKRSQKEAVTVTFCNPLNFKILNSNRNYKDYLETIDYIYSDGMLLCKLVERITGQKCARASFDGNSIAPKVFELCKKYKLKVALVGTTNPLIKIAVEKLKDEIDIHYYRNGFFLSDQEIDIFFDEIQQRNIDFILFGMGAPHQEKMLYYIKEKKLKLLAFTCGGYLDQIANRGLKYYPEFYNKYNLRWLYRIFKEPGKLLHRYFVDYSLFYFIYGKSLFNFNKSNKTF